MLVYGAGADPIWSEPESAPELRTSGAGAAQKSGGSATLENTGTQKIVFKSMWGYCGFLRGHVGARKYR